MPQQQRPPKSFKAVTNPEKFKPFPTIETLGDFEGVWKKNRPWVLANLSHAAYHSPKTIGSLMKRFGATDIRTYDVRGAQAFLAVWPDKAVLAFRGTQPTEKPQHSSRFVQSLQEFLEQALGIELPDEYVPFLGNDVLADLMFQTKSFGNAKVHKGFLKESNKLWRSLIVRDLKKLTEPNGLPVSVTGHSLGGAMATIAGMRNTFHEVVTFGEPRVGRDISSEFKAKRHIRYVNGDDPVTKIPPRWWPFSYEHHGTRKKIVDPDGPNAIYDHSIIYYAENLAFPNS